MIAPDALSWLFIGCFLVGMVFLLLTTFLGSLGHGHVHAIGHHVGHVHVHTGTHVVSHGHTQAGHTASNQTNQVGQGGFATFLGFVNPSTIVFFLLGFGFFGYIFHAAIALPLLITLILAAVSGLVLAALLLMLLARIFANSEGATIQDVSDRTGLLGKVSITLQPNNLGEIIYISPSGARKSVPARGVNGQRIERDQEVVVVSYNQGVAEVDTWEHFVEQDEPRSLEAASDTEIDALRALLDDPSKNDTEYAIGKELPKE